MNHRPNHTNWNEKFRPQKLEDVILPSLIKRQLIGAREKEISHDFLFFGNAGTGKTTCAKLINPDNTVFYNCATEGKLEHIAKLERLCSSYSVYSGKRVVVLDEADNLSLASQAALKVIIEKCASTTMFILTTNHVEKLTIALRSRFTEVCFSVEAGDIQLRNELKNRATQIVAHEGVTPDSYTIDSIIRKHFPDMRKTLGTLQFECGLA